MTGYTPDECLAMADYPLPLVVDADQRERLQYELKHSTMIENIELRIRRKNGELRWMAACLWRRR